MQMLNGMSWDSDNDDDVDDVEEKWEKVEQPKLSGSWQDLTDDKRESKHFLFALVGLPKFTPFLLGTLFLLFYSFSKLPFTMQDVSLF